MGLRSVIRKGVAIIDKVTGAQDGLQDEVQFYAWIGSDDFGGPEYDVPISMEAIVEEKQYTRRMSDGTEITQRASITIPRPITPNGAAERREPIDPRDKFILPSGFTGPILFVDGTVDPDTHAPYSYEIVLG